MEENAKKTAIEDLIITATKQANYITEEQVALIRDLYAEDSRDWDDIKQELLSYFDSIKQVNTKTPMKNSDNNATYSLNIESLNKGIYIGEAQMDLISIIEIGDIAGLILFVRQCSQLNYSELEEQGLYKMQLDMAKRKVFDDYRDTLIGTKDLKMDPGIILRKKLHRLGLSYDKIDKVIELYQENNIEDAINYIIEGSSLELKTIAKINFEIQSLDYDDVKSSSYEELEALSNEILKFNRITIAVGEYSSVMCNGKFNPYHVERALSFCKKHKLHARYHCLLSQSTLEHFKDKPREKIIEELRRYILASIEYINEYNIQNSLNDGKPLINAIDIFDELINLRKDKSRKVGYYGIFEDLGLTLEDLADIFAPAISNKQPGVEYIYNEAFVETKEKRKIQLSLAEKIHNIAPELIDTFGSQMHITIDFKEETIKETFNDLKKFSDETGIKLAITEFDIHASNKTLSYLKSLGKTVKEIAAYVSYTKLKKINMISEIAQNSDIKFTEIGYYSKTNSMDHSKKKRGMNTLYGGLFGSSLEPKAIQEVVEYLPHYNNIKKTDNVSNYLDALNKKLETQPKITPKDCSSVSLNPVKQSAKTNNESSPKIAQDDSGFANFPQLLIMGLILVGILYILLM